MSNNFLQWNPSQNNQEDDATWAADTLRVNGAPASSGTICPSIMDNKFRYQVSTMVAALGQMLDAKGFTISDSVIADLATELANIITTAETENLRIYPEILEDGNVLSITDNEDGTITVDAGQSWLHRGIQLYSSSDYSSGERTFTMVASKTYHLRWNPSDGFVLMDIADIVYNPGAIDEIDVSFDSDYDDMIVARVVTDGSNAATITALINKNVMTYSGSMTDTTVTNSQGNYILNDVISINWARTPTANQEVGFALDEVGYFTDRFMGTFPSISRYGMERFIYFSFHPSAILHITVYGEVTAYAV